MKLCAAGLELIKKSEGFRSKVYLDMAGLPTIGYGHRLVHPELLSRRNLRNPGRSNPLMGCPRSRAGRLPTRHCATDPGPIRRTGRLHLQSRFRTSRLFHPAPET